MRELRIFLIFFSISLFANAQHNNPLLTQDTEAQQKWVDSLYDSFTLEEKIGQLFMIDVNTKKDTAEINKALRLIENQKVGGVIFMKGYPTTQAKITNKFQAASKTPLLVATDAEWGLAMRLDSTYAYPWNMTLGAVTDNKLIERVGFQIGKHNKRLGIHINFAPDIDINTNPNNPIIGNRSFGEDKFNVTEKAAAFTKGMQDAGVMACGKHFPGHGDTEVDSHKTLPTISFSEERLDSVELFPYKKLIDQNLASVMVAHLNVPSLEAREGYPSSLSESIITDLLKKRLGFNGLVFTDALNMKGVSNYSTPGEIDLAAFLAGNDMLLISEDVVKSVEKLKEAYDNGIITEERLAYSVKKVLQAKYKAGLNAYTPVETKNLIADLNTIDDKVLYEQVMEAAITVVKNEKNMLPVKDFEKKKIAYVRFGDDDGSGFLEMLQKYTSVTPVSGTNLSELLEALEPFNTVVIGHHRSNDTPWKDYKMTDQELVWLYEIARQKKVILSTFVKPYSLRDLKTTANIEGIIVGYQNSKEAQEKVAQIIFGALGAQGRLPVSANDEFPVGCGVTTANLYTLKYGLPETVGMSSKLLMKVDSLANRTVSSGMAPGLQILVARKGKVVYHKAFGRPIYGSEKKVKETDLYDLASLTKILATLPMTMKLVEEGAITLNTTVGEMLPEFRKTNKADITVLEILTHYGRLKPWIPFYLNTLESGTKKPMPEYYSDHATNKYNIQVADELYLRKDYPDTILKLIEDSELLNKAAYRYSDLAFYIMKEFIEKHYNKPLDQLVQTNFYEPLGASFTTYKPLEKFPKGNIIPSEIDDYFRHQTVQGYVHDMGAAMLGGVGGHAGLFSNANDVAKIMQMFLQNGYYGGKRYFKPETINKFNDCVFCKKDNRRGIGFDKPQLEGDGPTCGCASMSSFGHSGFTGTYTWADPESDLVYVFLSNRTYPTQNNQKLITENVRSNIQQLIYDAITSP